MRRGGEDGEVGGGEERAGDETSLDWDTASKSEPQDGVFDLVTPGLGAGSGRTACQAEESGVTWQVREQEDPRVRQRSWGSPGRSGSGRTHESGRRVGCHLAGLGAGGPTSQAEGSGVTWQVREQEDPHVRLSRGVTWQGVKSY